MSAPSPESTPRSRNGEAPTEYSRLEALLAERARDAQAQRTELARLRAVLRDATSDFDRVLAEAEPQTKIELARQRDAAVTRALDAEAARAEALFRLDEVMGRLADASNEPNVTPTGATPAGAPEALDQDDTALTARVNALEAQLAQAQAERALAAARATSAENELLALRTHVQALEGELRASAERHADVDNMADALRDTKRLLSELARAVQRATKGLSRREAPAEAAPSLKPD